jgi:hypothetical protein
MPIVDVPGVGRVKFPEGTTPQQMEAALKKAQPEMGSLEQFGRGALKSVTDIGYGLKQLGAEGGEALGLVSPQTVQQLRREQDIREIEAAPYTNSLAGQLGYLGGSIGSLMIPGAALGRVGGAAGQIGRAISAPRTLGGAAAAGGALGAVQPVGTEDERLFNVGLGAVGSMGGQLIGRGLARVAQPTTSAPAPQVQRAITRLEKAGVPVDVAERAGSENLRMIRRFLTDNPISAGIMKKGQEATQTAFNRAALKLIGEQGEAAIPEVVDRAASRIGKVMDDVAARNTVKVDNKMLMDLGDIEDEAKLILEPSQFAPLKSQIDNILSKASSTGGIDGAAYQRIRTIAGELSKNPALKRFSGNLRETIDSALERTAGKTDAEAIRTARKQYRNLLKIEDAIGTTETGDISIPRLAAATSVKRERAAALRNRGDAELARLARSAMTVREAFPQSGTAPRQQLQTIGNLLAPGIAGATYGALQGQSPTDATLLALAGGALGVASPAAAARAYQSNALRNYILQGVQNQLAREAMLAPATRGVLTYGAPAALLSD